MAWNIVYSSGIVAPAQNYGGYTPTLYAAPTDLGTGDGSSEDNAMDFATAIGLIGNGSTGRCLGVLPGVYSAAAATNTRWQTCFTVANSGTSGDPIVIVCKYPAAYNYDTPSYLTELRNSNYATQQNPVIGVGDSGLDYIRFIGFYADQTYAPPRLSNGTFVIGPSSTGIAFEQCWVKQLDTLVDIDNCNSIYLEGCTNPELINNYITGGNSGGTLNHNAAAFTLYGVVNFLAEHNYFYNVNCGIFVKGSNAGIGNSGIIRFNLGVDLSHTLFEMAEIQPASIGFSVTQNLAIRCARGLNFDQSVAARCTDISCVNNTFVDCTDAGVNQDNTAAMTNCSNEQNIIAFMSSTAARALQISNSVAPLTSEDNLYYEAGGSATFYQNGSSYADLAAWYAGTSKDGTSAEGNPNFIDAGADNYHRSSYADGRGCYITGTEEIGIQAQ